MASEFDRSTVAEGGFWVFRILRDAAGNVPASSRFHRLLDLYGNNPGDGRQVAEVEDLPNDIAVLFNGEIDDPEALAEALSAPEHVTFRFRLASGQTFRVTVDEC